MRMGLAVALLAFSLVPLIASGPYSPPRFNMRRDETYERGKALWVGEVKVGTGATCATCHVKDLNRKRLQSVRFNLQQSVENCVRTPDRVNGKIQAEDTEALVYYIAKRYGL